MQDTMTKLRSTPKINSDLFLYIQGTISKLYKCLRGSSDKHAWKALFISNKYQVHFVDKFTSSTGQCVNTH